MQFIPILNSLAGASLTLANWEEVDSKIASFYLDDLLIKPGLDVLESITNLKEYLAWSNTLVLNLSLLQLNDQDSFVLRSNYDGSLIKIEKKRLIALLQRLDADFFILPEAIKNLELSNKMNSYYRYDKKASFDDFYQKIKETRDTLIYVSGDFSFIELKRLKGVNNIYIESNSPASSAINGLIYSQDNTYAINDSSMIHQYQPLDKTCLCPTCKAGFTRAYLHHLFAQTPLLCHRYLILHNIFQMNVLKPN